MTAKQIKALEWLALLALLEHVETLKRKRGK
jgi:hypothetical protein